MKVGEVSGVTRGTARIYARAREMRVSQSCEVNYFATKHGITRAQARELIERIGGDKLNAAAVPLAKKLLPTSPASNWRHCVCVEPGNGAAPPPIG